MTVWTGLAASGEFVGAELPSTAIAALLPTPLSSLPDSYPVLLSPSGRWLSAGVAAGADLSLPDGFEGTPAVVPGMAARALLKQQPQLLRTSLHGVAKDFFTAPVLGPGWIVASVVPDRALAPAAASLGDGIRSGVRTILLPGAAACGRPGGGGRAARGTCLAPPGGAGTGADNGVGAPRPEAHRRARGPPG